MDRLSGHTPNEDEIFEIQDSADLSAWVLETLRCIQPDADISSASIMLLSRLLDNLTRKILEEAKSISLENGRHPLGDQTESPTSAPLTSSEIRRAIRKILPGNPGDLLRPYLPSVTKHARHLDKQSLKRMKRPRP